MKPIRARFILPLLSLVLMGALASPATAQTNGPMTLADASTTSPDWLLPTCTKNASSLAPARTDSRTPAEVSALRLVQRTRLPWSDRVHALRRGAESTPVRGRRHLQQQHASVHLPGGTSAQLTPRERSPYPPVKPSLPSERSPTRAAKRQEPGMGTLSLRLPEGGVVPQVASDLRAPRVVRPVRGRPRDTQCP